MRPGMIIIIMWTVVHPSILCFFCLYGPGIVCFPFAVVVLLFRSCTLSSTAIAADTTTTTTTPAQNILCPFVFLSIPICCCSSYCPQGFICDERFAISIGKREVYLHLYSRYLFIILLLLLRGMNKLSIYCYTCEWYNHGYGVRTTRGNNGLFEINISKRFLLVPAMNIPRCSRFTHPPRDGDDDDWPITRNHDAA